MAKYRKKPIVIEAVQFKADDISTQANVNFGYPNNGYAEGEERHPFDGEYWISTLEGQLTISEGDWIITGVKGEHYPCKPDIFEATYELVVYEPEHA